MAAPRNVRSRMHKIVTLPAPVAVTATAWTAVDPAITDVVLGELNVGDTIMASVSGSWDAGAPVAQLDVVLGTTSVHFGGAANGVRAWAAPTINETPFGGAAFYTLQALDVPTSREVTFSLRARLLTADTRTLADFLQLTIVSLGPPQ